STSTLPSHTSPSSSGRRWCCATCAGSTTPRSARSCPFPRARCAPASPAAASCSQACSHRGTPHPPISVQVISHEGPTTMNAAHPTDEQLSAHLDGEAEATVADHVAGCPVCAAALDRLRLVTVALSAPVEPPSAEVRERAIAFAV